MLVLATRSLRAVEVTNKGGTMDAMGKTVVLTNAMS